MRILRQPTCFPDSLVTCSWKPIRPDLHQAYRASVADTPFSHVLTESLTAWIRSLFLWPSLKAFPAGSPYSRSFDSSSIKISGRRTLAIRAYRLIWHQPFPLLHQTTGPASADPGRVICSSRCSRRRNEGTIATFQRRRPNPFAWLTTSAPALLRPAWLMNQGRPTGARTHGHSRPNRRVLAAPESISCALTSPCQPPLAARRRANGAVCAWFWRSCALPVIPLPADFGTFHTNPKRKRGKDLSPRLRFGLVSAWIGAV